jgi:hypothetical protein
MFCEEQFSKKLCFKKVLKNGLERLGGLYLKNFYWQSYEHYKGGVGVP